MPPKVVVITGPTATGKTKLGVLLAQKIGGEVISADSMQIYEHMDIGTAKPMPEEMENIPHHMVGCVSPFENYSVSRYVEEAGAVADDIIARGKTPVIVGGTGLYIDALLAGREFAPQPSSEKIRAEIESQYDEDKDACLAYLASFDPESGEKLKLNDKKRIVRAIEVYKLTGKTITEHNALSRLIPPRFEACKIALSFTDRQDLYDRINRRVDIMMEQGLLDEINKLLDMGLTEKTTAMQAIGYKELLASLRGECSIEEGVEKIKMESRRYAKRQLSWLGRDEKVNWIFWEKEPDFAFGLQRSTSFLEKIGII